MWASVLRLGGRRHVQSEGKALRWPRGECLVSGRRRPSASRVLWEGGRKMLGYVFKIIYLSGK